MNNSVEDRIRDATRAAAGTLRTVRPLDLPLPGAPTSGGAGIRRTHRWKTWMAPVTAAAAVIALAISLVIVRDIPGGHGGPATSPAAVSGVPRYYVTTYVQGTKSSSPRGLLVGDTFTGAKLATVSAPRGSSFMAVTAAADDRTFVAGAARETRTGYSLPLTWYLLRIAPGTSTPARLTRLPALAMPSGSTIGAIALSASGRELAVTLLPNDVKYPIVRALLQIYSVATGKLLRSWSSRDPSVFGGVLGSFVESNKALTWVDDDRAITFPSSGVIKKPNPSQNIGYVKLWRLDVTAAGGDLIADSRVIWSTESAASSPPRCMGPSRLLVSANGKTVACATSTSLLTVGSGGKARVRWTLSWLAYSTSAPKVARTLYKVVVDAPGSWASTIDVQWVAASGGTLIVDWGVGPTASMSLHFALLSHGKSTPLPFVPTVGGDVDFWGIAW